VVTADMKILNVEEKLISNRKEWKVKTKAADPKVVGRG
jgi:hypothetical protein